MSFQAFPFSREKTLGELKKYLSLPQTPLCLSSLHRLRASDYDSILLLTRELAIRTARSYAAFFNPVLENCFEKVPRLPWAKEVSLREFQYCVHLQDAARRYVDEKRRSDVPCASSPSLFSVLQDEQILRSQDEKVTGRSIPFHCDTYASTMRNRIISGLKSGALALSSLPFETSLALLRPEHSLLHVLVNETHIDYLPLNLWFSKFCQRRVGWRVLHEHLLHVLQPVAFPHVIQKNVDVMDLVFGAADVVLEIHSGCQIEGEDETLEISAKLEPAISHTTPAAPLVSSSRSASQSPAGLDAQSSSENSFAVDSHLKYVFRELLKNGYAAMVANAAPVVQLRVNIASDAQWFTVDIEDGGHGIDPTYENDIWRFGFTTSAHSENILEGFGVGLPTSKVYMDLWGGYIDAYSTPRGTTMRVRFPRSPTEVLTTDECDQGRLFGENTAAKE